MLDLLRREVGKLQRRRRKGDETVGMAGAELHQRFVLDADQLFGGIALGAVPERVDAERLDIDAGAVHLRQPGADVVPKQPRRLERMIDDLRGVGNDAMGVHVDRLDPLAGDHDFPALGMRVGVPARAAPRRRAGPGADVGRPAAVNSQPVKTISPLMSAPPNSCAGSYRAARAYTRQPQEISRIKSQPAYSSTVANRSAK